MSNSKKLICPNCNHTESIEKLNYRKDSKMYMAKLYLMQKEKPDLQIYTFICFSCNHLTNFAYKVNGNVEYFETYKYDSNIKFENYHDIHGEKNQFNTIKRLVADTNFDNDLDHVQKKLNALK
tara:strand:- start:403 stop:771 length:369 start_codon:yes stop_codon:yes gene_type:complete